MAIAGCSGGDDGSSATTTTGGGTVTTEPGADLPATDDPSYSEEWRKVATREAAKELEGTNKVVLGTPPGRAGDPEFHAITTEQTFASVSDVYAPFDGNVEIISAESSDHIARYRRELAAGREQSTNDLLLMEISALVESDVAVGDLSTIPGYIENPPTVKDPPYQIGFAMQGMGLLYNPETASAVPEGYDHLLTDDFTAQEIVADFTPNYLGIVGMWDQLGEDYLAQLGKEKQISLITSGFGAVDRLGKGEFGVTFGGILHLGLRIEGRGAPVEYVEDPSVWFWQPNLVGMSGKPPHPWAAKLFMDYFVRPDHAEFQAFAEGTLSLNGEVASPDWVPDLFRAENVYSPGLVPDIFGEDLTGNEITTLYGRALGAPIGEGGGGH